MRAVIPLVLLLAAQTCCAAWVSAQPPNLTGLWKVDFKFADGARHLLRFDARASGRGSFLLLDPRSSLSGEPEPSDAEWARSGEKGFTFSGPVEFPIGNVGREQGTLVFVGKLEADDSMSGSLAFFPSGQDPKDPEAVPSRKGSFKATRVSAPDEKR